MVLQLLCIFSLLKSHLPPFHEDSPLIPQRRCLFPQQPHRLTAAEEEGWRKEGSQKSFGEDTFEF